MTSGHAAPEVPVLDVPVDSLHENPENPRRISDDRMAALMRSIEAEPAMLRARPIVALPDGTIIAGNMRHRAAVQLGYTHVPAVTVDLTDDRARAWLLRDNNEYGEWDDDGLAAMLQGMAGADFDLDLTGFSSTELERLLADDDDDAGATTTGDKLALMDITVGDPEHLTTRGEVWMVGPHHLAVVTVYTGWPVYLPLLGEDDLLVPYPTPILPLSSRARAHRLVMVQPDRWLAGHLLDRYAEGNGDETVVRL